MNTKQTNKIKMHKYLHICVISLLGTFHANGAVLFQGKTIGYQYLYDTIGSQQFSTTFTVNNGIELTGLTNGSGSATADFSDTNILVDYFESSSWTAAPFNGFRVYDINDTLPAFTSVTLNPITNMSGLTSSRITFDDNNIWVNWQGLAYNSGTFVGLDVVAVPEPSTSLYSVICLSLACTLRRCRNK